MPKYTEDKIAGYFLYFTNHCIVEAMHVHANKNSTRRSGSSKFWVYADGTSKLVGSTRISKKDQRIIQEYIANNYLEMYDKWQEKSDNGFKEV